MADPTPDCCQQRGWTYPDGGKRCHRHSTAQDRQLVADLDQSAKPILGIHGWPYGPNIDVRARQELVDWAAHYQFKLADTRCQELHWLRKGRCAVAVCNRLGHWMDHVTRWTRNGKPALILAQPYGLSSLDIVQLGGLLGVADDLEVHVSAQGWYGHGTVAVKVWNAAAYREHVRDA